jgi:hypothetical protein
MSKPIIRYWDEHFNEISAEEAKRRIELDPFNVAATIHEADDE